MLHGFTNSVVQQRRNVKQVTLGVVDVIADARQAFLGCQLPADSVLFDDLPVLVIHISMVFSSQKMGAELVVQQRLKPEIAIVVGFVDETQTVARHGGHECLSESKVDV